jgi:hypothetical protein
MLPGFLRTPLRTPRSEHYLIMYHVDQDHPNDASSRGVSVSSRSGKLSAGFTNGLRDDAARSVSTSRAHNQAARARSGSMIQCWAAARFHDALHASYGNDSGRAERARDVQERARASWT